MSYFSVNVPIPRANDGNLPLNCQNPQFESGFRKRFKCSLFPFKSAWNGSFGPATIKMGENVIFFPKEINALKSS